MSTNRIHPKKNLAVIIHLICLCLVIASIAILYVNSNFGRGIAWIRSESYTESDLFYNQLQSDVRAIFDYATLRDAFETDGEPDGELEILRLREVSSSSDATISYTLNEIREISEYYGYFLQDDGTITIVSPSETPYQNKTVLVEYKAYDPNPNPSAGPGHALAEMQELCYEVLTTYSRYCYVYYNMISSPSNLSFQLTCVNENEMLEGDTVVYTNVTSPSWEKTRHFGLYAEYTADDLNVDTNMSQVPTYIKDLVKKTEFNEQTFRHFIISVDTNFPYADAYTSGFASYESMRAWTIRGLGLMGFGILGCLFSLIYLIVVCGHETGSLDDAVQLRPLDHMSAEGCILFFLVAGTIVCYLGKVAGFRLLHLIIDAENWYFFERLMIFVLIYLISLLCFFSLLRRYKAGILWQGSWVRKSIAEMQNYFTQEATSHSAAYTYMFFVAANIILVAGSVYLLLNLESLLHQLLLAALILILAVLDLLVFLYVTRKALQDDKIRQAITNIASGDISYCVDVNEFTGKQKATADHINHIGKNLDTALQEKVKSERFKADLITNVSHDLKTPLTSIINYVDLIKRENIQNEKIQSYLEVLEQKSQRLKTLTEDLVEASKASSGNLKLEISDIDFVELVQQTNGEFKEKFTLRNLELISRLPEQSILIEADGRRLWRVLENLYNNAFKYAMEHSRIYVDMVLEDDTVVFTIKNISQHPLNISSEELTERFVRGDSSRATEGSGLGLSIAQSLTQLQNGIFQLVIDGDLFKVYVKFPVKKRNDGRNQEENVLE